MFADNGNESVNVSDARFGRMDVSEMRVQPVGNDLAELVENVNDDRFALALKIQRRASGNAKVRGGGVMSGHNI